MKKYEVKVSGLVVGVVELTVAEVNALISDTEVALKEVK